jgi:uncharacterized protein (DUF362 family)
MTNIFIGRVKDNYASVIEQGLTFVGLKNVIKRSDRIAIKPNLTFPVFRQGVMTNPSAVEALVVYLRNFTDHLTICESDSGGYNRFSIDEVFASTGLTEIAKRYGVKLVNMSNVSSRDISFNRRFRRLQIPLPILLLDETDLFITMPVPKVHCNTGVSISMKNQWGVIQQPELRLKLHPYFNEVIYQINKALPRTISVVDGKYGLTRSGPMRGDVLELNWLVVGDNLFYVDYFVTQLMGVDYRRIPHLKYAFHREGVRSLDGVTFNTDFKPFASQEFYLERAWTDYPGVLTFNSRMLAYIGYESIFARPLHRLLYRFREPFY